MSAIHCVSSLLVQIPTTTHQPLPRVLVQEPHCHVEGGATPALETVRVRERVARLLRDVDHVDRAQTRREQRLVRVAPGGVHDEHAGVLADGLGEGLGAVLDDDVAPTDLAWHAGVERSAVGVLRVAQRWDDNLRLETRLALDG